MATVNPASPTRRRPFRRALLVFGVLVLLYHRFVSPLVNMGSLLLAPLGGLLLLVSAIALNMTGLFELPSLSVSGGWPSSGFSGSLATGALAACPQPYTSPIPYGTAPYAQAALPAPPVSLSAPRPPWRLSLPSWYP